MSFAKYYRNWMYELRLTSSINSSGKEKEEKRGKKSKKNVINTVWLHIANDISLADIYS